MNAAGLWVVSVISNPVRYQSRYNLYRDFEQRVLNAGANLMTVELAYGNRAFEVTEAGNFRHLQVRARDELWHKENLINLGIQELPCDWEYVAWVDADIEFVRKDWTIEIVQQLQHFKLIQCFQDAIDLGPNGEFIQKHQGFGWHHVFDSHIPRNSAEGPHWHPGFAWAARRETISGLGRLMDKAILGASDHHMAWALVGRAVDMAPQALTPGYKRMLLVWQEQAQALRLDQSLGYMPGTILRHWHGRKKDRRYAERWRIIHDHGYDPDLDVSYDWRGVLQLTDRGGRLRHDIRNYFRARNEDSIDP